MSKWYRIGPEGLINLDRAQFIAKQKVRDEIYAIIAYMPQYYDEGEYTCQIILETNLTSKSADAVLENIFTFLSST